MKPKGRVYFVGLGLDPREHATVESLIALGECDRVYASGLEPDDVKALRPYCRPGAIAPVADGGEAAQARAIAGEAARGRRVAFATLGHPFYAGEAGSLLAKACDARRVEWTSFGAVSPMGVALSLAGVTLGTTTFGMHAFEHRAFVARRVKPNPTWPLAIYFLSVPDAKSVRSCAEALARFFPAEHEALWCSGPLFGTREPLAQALARGEGIGRRDVLYLGPTAEASTTLGRTSAHQVVGRGPAAPEWVRP
jgi:precorrin-6B methylase 1